MVVSTTNLVAASAPEAQGVAGTDANDAAVKAAEQSAATTTQAATTNDPRLNVSCNVVDTHKTNDMDDTSKKNAPVLLQYNNQNLNQNDLLQSGRFVSPKRGHKCCGNCCDVRRAVVIVNLIWGALLLLQLDELIYFLKNYGNAVAEHNAQVNENGNDDYYAEMFTYQPPRYMVVSTIWTVCGLIAVAMGIFGAIRFQMYLVGVAAVYYTLQALGQLLLFIAYVNGNLIWTTIGMALFAYPHYYFVHEVRSGIMNQETYYISEEHSCCCV